MLALSALGFVRCWKSQTGVAKMGERTVRFGLKGSADISGILRTTKGYGLRLEIECKTGCGRLSEDQINFKGMIDKMGGLYFEARDVASAVAFCRKAQEY